MSRVIARLKENESEIHLSVLTGNRESDAFITWELGEKRGIEMEVTYRDKQKLNRRAKFRMDHGVLQELLSAAFDAGRQQEAGIRERAIKQLMSGQPFHVE